MPPTHVLSLSPAWCAGPSSYPDGLAERLPTTHSGVLVIKPQPCLCSLLCPPPPPLSPSPPFSSLSLLLLPPLPLPSPSFSPPTRPLATQLITTAGASGLLLQCFHGRGPNTNTDAAAPLPAQDPPQHRVGGQMRSLRGVGGIFVWSYFHGNLLDPSSMPLTICWCWGLSCSMPPVPPFTRPLAWPHPESRAGKQPDGQPQLQDRESEDQEPGRPGYLFSNWGLPLPGSWGGRGIPSIQSHCPEPGSWLYPEAGLCAGQWAERVQSQERSPQAVSREVLGEAQWEGAMGSPGGEREGS